MRGPSVNKAVRRNRTWAIVLNIVGGLFLLWGVAEVAGPWFSGDQTIGILLTPCALISAIVPFCLAAMTLGMAYGLHRRVSAATLCRACRHRLVLISVQDSNPLNPEEGYTEYVYRCPNCGLESTVVDA